MARWSESQLRLFKSWVEECNDLSAHVNGSYLVSRYGVSRMLIFSFYVSSFSKKFSKFRVRQCQSKYIGMNSSTEYSLNLIRVNHVVVVIFYMSVYTASYCLHSKLRPCHLSGIACENEPKAHGHDSKVVSIWLFSFFFLSLEAFQFAPNAHVGNAEWCPEPTVTTINDVKLNTHEALK